MNRKEKNELVLNQLLKIILRSYNEYTFTIEELIEVSGHSRTLVVKVIMLYFRMTPKKLIESIKIHFSLDYLFEGKRISTFYCEVGYSEARILSSAMKKRICLLPSEIYENIIEFDKKYIYNKLWMNYNNYSRINEILTERKNNEQINKAGQTKRYSYSY